MQNCEPKCIISYSPVSFLCVRAPCGQIFCIKRLIKSTFISWIWISPTLLLVMLLWSKTSSPGHEGRFTYVGNFYYEHIPAVRQECLIHFKKAYLLLLLWQGSGADAITMSVMLLTIRQNICLNFIVFGVLSVIIVTWYRHELFMKTSW